MKNTDIKGYNDLSSHGKILFDYVYQKHQNGVEDKEDWTAVEIKQRATYLKITFKNKKWLAYYPDGSWG